MNEANQVLATTFEEYFAQRGEHKNLDLTLERIDCALKDASTLHPSVRFIHIAGTNGKGSTAGLLSHILRDNGFSVLLFTSPHIEDLRERIQLDNTPLERSKFDALFIHLLPVIEKHRLSYFEALFLMCMNVELREGFVILETGLGGRFDATNTNFILKKTPVITTISQDHKEILGSNIYDILSEKLAIVKGNSPLFVGENKEFILEAVRKALPDTSCNFIEAETARRAEELYPAPFHLNYACAHAVAEHLLESRLALKSYPLPPARKERLGRVLLDGAHNVGGLLTLAESLKNDNVGAVVTSSTRERGLERHIKALSRLTQNIILTSIPDNSRSYSKKELLSFAEKHGLTVISKPDEALKHALALTEKLVLVTGSLYLCGYLRPLLRRYNAETSP